MKHWSEMSPRERDYLIAEEVMRLNVDYWNWPHGQGPMIVMGESPNMKALTEVPHYSTDIAAAWEVVEKLKVLMNIFNDFEIEISSSSEFRNEWEVSVKWYDDEQGYGPFYLTADTAPEAICLAALKALGINV